MSVLLTTVRDAGRLSEIAATLARHGFGHVLVRAGIGKAPPSEQPATSGTLAVRMRLVLSDLGPSFIKLGQIASTRSDVLPPDVVAELKKLQDSVPPVPTDAIRKEIEHSLGRPIDEIFARFDDVPLATASIGQVHRARLRAGFDEPGDEPQEREVVVKVQRPGTRATIERDLELLKILAVVIERTIEESRVYDPVGLVRQFERSIMAELDFNLEAQNGERFRTQFADDAGVRFPLSYRAASSSRVLTLEFFDGLKLRDAVNAGFDRKAIARRAVGLIVKMAFSNGFFHADPHPGNFIMLGTAQEPVIGVIDLGMVGRLTQEQRDKLCELLLAAASNDPGGVADALLSLGRPTRKVDVAAFRAEASMRTERHLGKSLKDINAGALLNDLIEGALMFGIEIPPDFLMAGKALITLDGIGKELDPELDVLAEARPYFVDYMKARLAPDQLLRDFSHGAMRYAGLAKDLPMHLREVLDDLRMGRLMVKTAETELAPAVERLGRRLLVGFVFIGLQIGGGLALLSQGPERLWVAGAAFGVSWLILAGFVVMAVLKRAFGKPKP